MNPNISLLKCLEISFLMILLNVQIAGAIKSDGFYFNFHQHANLSREYLLEKKGFLIDWVELEFTVSTDRKIDDIKVIKGSGNKKFNELQIHFLKKMEKVVFFNPKAKKSTQKMIKRFDLLWIEEDSPYYDMVIRPELKIISSLYHEQSETPFKKHLLMVNKYRELTANKEYFEVVKLEHDEDFTAFQINLQLLNNFDFGFVSVVPDSFEQLKNKHLISQYEYKAALTSYKYLENEPSLLIINDEIFEEYKYNEQAALKDKRTYWFERPFESRPELIAQKLFANYSGELTLGAYEDTLTVSATVLPSGRIENVELIKDSKFKRLNQIVLEALSGVYVPSAYKNYQPAKDEIVFELSFKKSANLKQ